MVRTPIITILRLNKAWSWNGLIGEKVEAASKVMTAKVKASQYSRKRLRSK